MIDVGYKYSIAYTVGAEVWSDDVITFAKVGERYVGKGLFNLFGDGQTMHIDAEEVGGLLEGEYKEVDEQGKVCSRGIMVLATDPGAENGLIGPWFDQDGRGSMSLVRQLIPVQK